MQILILIFQLLTWQALSQGLVTTAPDPKLDLPSKGLCAHRGAMTHYPENTLVAFQAAIDKGAHMIEFDVHLTLDQHLVIIHDETIDRTTEGQGAIADMTLKEIKRLDAGSWKDPKFAGQQIPTLSETLAMMPLNIWLNVHVKNTEGIGKLIAEEIVLQNRQHQAFLACTKAVADEAKKVSTEIKICNMDRQSSNWDYVHLTVNQKADFIQLKGEVSDEYPKLTEHLRKKDIRINYFGTDDPEKIEWLFNAGVDFPLVNNIIESIKVCERLGIAPITPIYREH